MLGMGYWVAELLGVTELDDLYERRTPRRGLQVSVWEKGLVVGVGVLRVGKAFFGRDSQPVDTAHTDNQYMCLYSIPA